MGHSPGIQFAGAFVMLGMGLLAFWLLRSGQNIRALLARAILSLTGHLRTRPDPWLEGTLRAAFAEFDRELALILRDRTYPLPAPARREPGVSRP